MINFTPQQARVELIKLASERTIIGIACDESVQLMFKSKTDGLCYDMVIQGNRDWLAEFVRLSVHDLVVAEPPNIVTFVRIAYKLWPDDECVKRLYKLVYGNLH